MCGYDLWRRSRKSIYKCDLLRHDLQYFHEIQINRWRYLHQGPTAYIGSRSWKSRVPPPDPAANTSLNGLKSGLFPASPVFAVSGGRHATIAQHMFDEQKTQHDRLSTG